MTKIEQIRVTGTQGRLISTPRPFSVRSNVVPISVPADRLAPAPAVQRFALGRKGRQARIRRRLLDGAFVAATMGTAALLWWSTR